MRALLAFDKFKHALTARAACEAAARGLRARHRDWQLDLCPLADGGEGFCEILTRAAGGKLVTFRVSGPRLETIDAQLGLVALGKLPCAVRARLDLPASLGDEARIGLVEMAAASGLALLAPEARDPWQTTSYGTGQLIRTAAELGAKAVLLGVGGSATHDLGLGALSALGLEFRGASGEKIRPPFPSRWESIASIEGDVFPSIPPLRLACDVDNPLVGMRGAAAVFAPQKGLKPEDFSRLEAATERLGRLLCEHVGRDYAAASQEPGAGAAGGIGFGFSVAARACLVSGSALVGEWLRLEERLAAADVVLTGEGRFDSSSLGGKGPGALVERARQLGKPVHVFAGSVALSPVETPGNVSLNAITPAGLPLEQALREAGSRLAEGVRDAAID